MKKNMISEAIGNIDPKFVNEAISYTGKSRVVRRNVWAKVCAAAACVALVAAVGLGILGNIDHTVTLDNGDTLKFRKSNTEMMGSQDMDVFTRELTAEEIHMLFKDLSVDGCVIYDGETYNAIGAENKILGIEGYIDDVTLLVSVTGVNIDDTPITGGIETTSKVEGVPVTAGYSIFNGYICYYASFEMGGNTVYVEKGAKINDSKAVKAARNELASAIQNLIDNGEIDLSQLAE